MPATPSSDFLTSKAGPLPVWGWGALGVAGAYLFARWRQGKATTAAATSGTSTTSTVPGAVYANGQPVSGQPTYLIENNIPSTGSVYTAPSQPIQMQAPPPVPVVTPPATTPTPPVTTPVVTPPPAVTQAVPPSRIDYPTRTFPTPSAPPAAPQAPVAAPSVPRIVGEGTHRVVAGDTLSRIAEQARIPGGWQALWAYNLNPANNSAAQIAILRQRGPNTLYAGETIRVPEYA